jgi:Exopolyphosphatase
MEKAPKIAAIDLGTNSFHMAIATLNSNGVIKILSREKEMVRLGSSGKDMKYLQEDAIERGIETLYRFSKIAESENAIIRACATSALREALNRDAFIRRVRNELDINIEIISGVEEGRLIYLGVIHALPLNGKKTLVIDIGGGSTETIIGKDGKTEFIHSEKIGAIRLTKLCCEQGVFNKDIVLQLREFIRGEWAVVLENIKQIGFDIAVGTSGTILTLANMVLASKQQPIPEQLMVSVSIRLTF